MPNTMSVKPAEKKLRPSVSEIQETSAKLVEFIMHPMITSQIACIVLFWKFDEQIFLSYVCIGLFWKPDNFFPLNLWIHHDKCTTSLEFIYFCFQQKT